MRKALFGLVLAAMLPSQAFAQQQEYLYYREVKVPPFQKLHEFFDMPNRPGRYEVSLLSDSAGPLTFHILRVREEVEKTIVQRRSYHVGDHEFREIFANPDGADDLIVEIANSNPATAARVSVYVVELGR